MRISTLVFLLVVFLASVGVNGYLISAVERFRSLVGICEKVLSEKADELNKENQLLLESLRLNDQEI